MRERERQRIACGLHDEAGQALALAQLRLRELEGLECAPTVKALIDETRSLVDDAVGTIRAVTRDLGVGLLVQGRLDDALRGLAARLQSGRQDALLTHLELHSPPVPLDPTTTAVVLRVANELLANVRRHSGAKQVWLRCACGHGHVHVTVSDDGRGFDPRLCAPSGSAAGGFGLSSCAAQLAALGGWLEVNSAPGSGTQVRIVLPLPQGRRSPATRLGLSYGDTGGSARASRPRG
ncbi:sensor histidine kinase [Cupriavidus consociatus]|uniref:sensor histidine kinase n=1 Tax=Cupriavidus consociatus TaxID=2821357 RepID=UPI0024DFC04B|nr:ATP-binding protein [Cupriavidus sp. LEh21]MDK2659130.1 ATP-binding protein [Cupriavidus sp. LEh21]